MNFNIDRHCPVYNRVIDADLCYESVMCLSGLIKTSALKELDVVKDIETARKICDSCRFSDLSGEDWEEDGEA